MACGCSVFSSRSSCGFTSPDMGHHLSFGAGDIFLEIDLNPGDAGNILKPELPGRVQ